MLTLKKIKKSYGSRRILNGVSFSLSEGQRVALVGPNGAGKSTLLKIIAGMLEPDFGEIQLKRSALVGYLPQETEIVSGENINEFLRRMSGIQALEQTLSQLESQLFDPVTLERYEALTEEYHRLGGHYFRDRVQFFFKGLSLSELSLKYPVAKLSGGQKRKLSLVAVLMRGVDLLLLDEPTNNLDLPALLWLETYLVLSGTTLLIASHDRCFLDRVVTKVIELDIITRKAQMLTGNWSTYAEMKARSVRRQRELYRKQEEEKERIQSSAEEKKAWIVRAKNKPPKDNDKMLRGFRINRAAQKHGARAKALETKVRQLHRIEKPIERSPLSFWLSTEELMQGPLITLSRVQVGYPKQFQTQPLSLTLNWGERVALLGENGAGKSTLLKTIAGELPPLQGKVIRARRVIFGNLMQEYENIPMHLTPIQLYAKLLGIKDHQTVLLLLSQFQFIPEFADIALKELSPGERVRFILSVLVARGSHILLLDEPTNHLDLEAIEALETALEDYGGTILVVTHDRTLLEHLEISSTYVLSNGRLDLIKGPMEYEMTLRLKIERRMKRLEERLGRRH